MHLSVKSDHAYDLAAEISTLTGETLTEAVTRALDERLQRIRHKKDPMLIADLEAIVERFNALPVLSTRSEDEILGYDERGLPES